MKSILILILLLSHSVQAEIYKEALTTDSGIKFYWWPVLPKVEGWSQDRESSLIYSMNAQVPDGLSFTNAETVIYSKAVYKPRVPDIKSLTAFIENDKAQFLSKKTSIKITQLESIKNADGALLNSLSFISLSGTSWEQVSYLEEGDFFLIFTISSRSEQGLKESLDVYKEFVENYKKEL